jgi:hypothetical protein
MNYEKIATVVVVIIIVVVVLAWGLSTLGGVFF